MKPFENPENLYIKAIEQEKQSMQNIDFPIPWKNGSRRKLWAIAGLASSIAAIVLFGWFVIYPKMEQNKLVLAQSVMAKIPTPELLKTDNKDLQPIVRFNASVKNISISNETIQRFNTKLKKFNKSNT